MTEGDPIVKICREKQREIISDHRQADRIRLTDLVRRGLGDFQLLHCDVTPKDVPGLASRIKRRKHAEENDLIRLSNAFLHFAESSAAFLNIPGAVNVVIKQLSGTDTRLQLLCAELLCNLALADEFCCEKLAKAAGSYLLTLTDSSDSVLSQTCLWTLHNLTAGSGKACHVLETQKMSSKMISVLERNFCDSINYWAANCLIASLNQPSGQENLSLEETNKIIRICTEETQIEDLETNLLLLLNTLFYLEFKTPKSEVVSNYCLDLFCKTDIDKSKVFLLLIRILGNLIARTEIVSLENAFSTHSGQSFVLACNSIFKASPTAPKNELKWMIGNILNRQSESLVFKSVCDFVVPQLILNEEAQEFNFKMDVQ